MATKFKGRAYVKFILSPWLTLAKKMWELTQVLAHPPNSQNIKRGMPAPVRVSLTGNHQATTAR